MELKIGSERVVVERTVSWKIFSEGEKVSVEICPENDGERTVVIKRDSGCVVMSYALFLAIIDEVGQEARDGM